jgi:hypothetical protein
MPPSAEITSTSKSILLAEKEAISILKALGEIARNVPAIVLRGRSFVSRLAEPEPRILAEMIAETEPFSMLIAAMARGDQPERNWTPGHERSVIDCLSSLNVHEFCIACRD